MKRKHQRTLELIFARPVSANVRWDDIEALLRELGAEFEEREGSRIEVFLFGLVRVFHRPHPSPARRGETGFGHRGTGQLIHGLLAWPDALQPGPAA